MQSVWNNNNRLVLLSTLIMLLLHHPALADDNDAAIMVEIGNLFPTRKNLTCDSAGLVTCSNARVQRINLSGQKLAGELPRDLNKLSELQSLNVMNNSLNGSLPNLSKLTNLLEIHLDSNQFKTYTKGYLSGLTGLQTFSIDNNPIDNWSVFTDLMEDSTNLISFSANQAGFSGSMNIASFGKLQHLHLSYNKIEGPLPAALNGSQIQTLWLNNQQGVKKLSGQIDVIRSMPLVQQVWLHDNQFTGPIPDLSNCNHLYDLILKDNQLTKTIPPTIGNLASLKNLTLKKNELSGHVQLDLTNLVNLTLVNVSQNSQLWGTITVRSNVTVNIEDDPNLQVIRRDSSTPASGNTPSSGSINPPPGSPAGSGGMSPWAIAAIVIVVIIVAAVVVICVYRKSSKKKAYKRTDQQSDSEVHTTNASGGSQQLSSHVSININGWIPMGVLIQVTDNFSEAKIIGRGGFGTVYRGKLPDGTEVAVKRMVAPVFMSSKGMAEYKAEIEVLSNVRHRNLVGLIGFCENKDERLLVYEFMPQGTLGDHLFDWRQRGGRPLTWSQRAAIALDVARGVDYLHTHLGESFIHRDLKPNNILLGDDMRAKVADFGLVKNAGSATESIQTKVAGTFGYFAPEYWETGRVTTKIDVYAFGVILMEMISGRKVVDDSEDAIDGGNLMLRFRRILAGKEDVRGLIDPTLHADEDEETYRKICEVVELAGHCTVSDPSKRCNMGYAAHVLTPKKQWTQSNSDVPTTFSVDPDLQLPNLVEQWRAGIGMPSASYTYA